MKKKNQLETPYDVWNSTRVLKFVYLLLAAILNWNIGDQVFHLQNTCQNIKQCIRCLVLVQPKKTWLKNSWLVGKASKQTKSNNEEVDQAADSGADWSEPALFA